MPSMVPLPADRVRAPWSSLLPLFMLLLAVTSWQPGCAHSSPVGGGGVEPLFAVSIESIDGRSVVTEGHMSQVSYMVQVGERLVRVWPGALAPEGPSQPATLMEAGAESLKSGILIESGWNHAVVHEVTEGELEAGAAMVFVPGDRRTVVVELRFRRLNGADSPVPHSPPDTRS